MTFKGRFSFGHVFLSTTVSPLVLPGNQTENHVASPTDESDLGSIGPKMTSAGSGGFRQLAGRPVPRCRAGHGSKSQIG